MIALGAATTIPCGRAALVVTLACAIAVTYQVVVHHLHAASVLNLIGPHAKVVMLIALERRALGASDVTLVDAESSRSFVGTLGTAIVD